MAGTHLYRSTTADDSSQPTKFRHGVRACVRSGSGVRVRMYAIPAIVQYLLRSRADDYLSKIQRGYGHPPRAGALEGTANVNGIGAGYGLRSSCGVVYSVRG